ncbi:unnamed protein product [Adineta steineri]|uniref:Uncharacterized protein n=1 Tax=Adineta steineri TaxID=433720 RepID=A0A813SX31_9BILA|nr:unnamed protein product [Adineta steineri]CAF1239247.1 unnamed protein product [Adineta steineri]
MTFTDIITSSSKCLSVDADLNKHDQHRTLKRLNTSILNLFSKYRQTDSFKKQDTNEELQKQNSFLQPPSALSRSISNKSMTFALVFDEIEIQNKPKSFDQDKSQENEDLVIVVPNKYVNNEPNIINSNRNIEPYPFRSELPTYSLPKSHSKKNLLHHLIHFHRPKKLRHPIKSNQSINTINRSRSAPTMLYSLSSSTNDSQSNQPLKKCHRWFKLPPLTRFFQLFVKNNPKQKSHRRKPTTLRRYSEMIY